MAAMDPDPHGLPVPGGLSERLWQDSQLEAYRALQHPFVIALGLGVLARDTFRHYVAQDAHYLHFFARAYACALDKCSGLFPEARVVLQQLLMGVHMELRLHDSYARGWGVDLGSVVVHPATHAYTDFLMEVAEDPETSVAEVLAAMVPCSRLYAFLGCQLARAHPVRHGNPYRDWVTMYSGFDYLVLPMQKERLLDRVGLDVPYDRLRSLYRRAMELEVAFFSAQPGLPAARRIDMLVCDFDDTCSEKDTIGTLLAAAIDAAVQRAAEGERAAARERLEGVVAGLVSNYGAKHAALLAEILPEAADEGAAAAAFDRASLERFVERLSDFDVAMNAVAIDSGILAGMSRDDVAAAAAKVQLKAGCRDALRVALAAGVAAHVVSVNWSGDFVAAALGLPAAAAAESGAAAAPAARGALSIHANELARGADGLTTGGLLRGVECARDKGRLFGELLATERAAAAAKRAAGSGAAGASVFVGDSSTDVLPLLAADYGIVVGSNKLLRRALARHGVALRPLAAAPLVPAAGNASSGDDASGGGGPVVYEAAGWDEINAFLFGPDGAGGGAAAGVARVGGGAAAVARAAAAGGGRLPRVLTIAGSDSGGGAGIQADLKSIMAMGCFGMSAITALTAQNSRGVQAVHPVPAEFLERQLDSVLGDLGADAVKTGMLPDADAVRLVARKVREYGVSNLVVDPVMISTSGHALAGDCVAAAMAADLLPLAALVTPNIPEALVLLGHAAEASKSDGGGGSGSGGSGNGGGAAMERIESVEDMREAARRLRALGPRVVLVKGGHMAAAQAERAAAAAAGGEGGGGDDDLVAVDVLYDGERFLELHAPYVHTRNTHGTGCTLGAAAAAGLARRLPVADAVREAKAYLTAALAASAGLALGAGPQHPFDHGAGLARAAAAAAPATAAPAGAAARHAPNAIDLRLYAVTDPGCNARAGRSLLDAVAAAVAGGATVVQVREKDAPTGAFVAAAREAARACRAAGVPLVINDRVDVALAVGADGVHVGQDDMPAAAVRKLIGPGKILGVSVKTPEEAVKAAADGADYLGAGAIVPTGTKDSSVIGLDGLRRVCEAVDIPVVAIGGVGAHNAAATLAAGAEGVAVVSALFAAPDVAAAARELRAAVDAAAAEVAAAKAAAAAGGEHGGADGECAAAPAAEAAAVGARA